MELEKPPLANPHNNWFRQESLMHIQTRVCTSVESEGIYVVSEYARQNTFSFQKAKWQLQWRNLADVSATRWPGWTLLWWPWGPAGASWRDRCRQQLGGSLRRACQMHCPSLSLRRRRHTQGGKQNNWRLKKPGSWTQPMILGFLLL